MSQEQLRIQQLEALLQQSNATLQQKDAELQRLKRTSSPQQPGSANRRRDVSSEFQLFSSPTSSLQDGRPRSSTTHTVPRGLPGLTVQTQNPFGRSMDRSCDDVPPSKRARTMSQQSAPAQSMMRSSSARSTSSGPFTAHGPITPPHLHRGPQQNANAPNLEDYLAKSDEPVNAAVYAHSMRRTPSSQRQPPMPTVSESNAMDVGLDPLAWLAKTETETDFSPHGSSLAASPMGYISRERLSPADAFQMNIPTSTCPSMSSGITGGDTSPMSRQNSNFHESQSISGDLAMCRIESSSYSQPATDMSRQESYTYMASNGRLIQLKNGSPDDALFAMGANFSHDMYPSSAPTASLLAQHLSMERSQSEASTQSSSSAALHDMYLQQSTSMERTSSARSTASLRIRAKEALERQLQNAHKAPLLQPKPAQDRAEQDQTRNGTKVALSRPKYQRPQHPKVKCNQCDEYPDGFRGEHELRRHTEAKHKSLVKKFQCSDPATRGMHSPVKVVNPLEKCKACRAGKLYGAYYNAAAHLRRTHFREKPARSKRSADDAEKRGGKGGGDWPSMPDLKLWMIETTVPTDQPDAFNADAADGDEDMEHSPTNMLTTSYDMSPYVTLGGDAENAAQDLGGFTSNAMDPAMYLSSMEAAALATGSANFDFNESLASLPQGMMMDGSQSFNYNGSTVSSSATVTPTNNGYAESMSQQHVSPDHMNELDFSMTFIDPGITTSS